MDGEGDGPGALVSDRSVVGGRDARGLDRPARRARARARSRSRRARRIADRLRFGRFGEGNGKSARRSGPETGAGTRARCAERSVGDGLDARGSRRTCFAVSRSRSGLRLRCLLRLRERLRAGDSFRAARAGRRSSSSSESRSFAATGSCSIASVLISWSMSSSPMVLDVARAFTRRFRRQRVLRGNAGFGRASPVSVAFVGRARGRVIQLRGPVIRRRICDP